MDAPDIAAGRISTIAAYIAAHPGVTRFVLKPRAAKNFPEPVARQVGPGMARPYLYRTEELDAYLRGRSAVRKPAGKWPGFPVGTILRVTNAAGITRTGRLTSVGAALCRMELGDSTTTCFARDAILEPQPDGTALSNTDFGYVHGKSRDMFETLYELEKKIGKRTI